MTDRVGQQLGNYRLLKLIGRGNFAEVYLGEHQHLNTQAAIKVLNTHFTSEDRDRLYAGCCRHTPLHTLDRFSLHPRLRHWSHLRMVDSSAFPDIRRNNLENAVVHSGSASSWAFRLDRRECDTPPRLRRPSLRSAHSDRDGRACRCR